MKLIEQRLTNWLVNFAGLALKNQMTLTNEARQAVIHGNAPLTHDDQGRSFINFDGFRIENCEGKDGCIITFTFESTPMIVQYIPYIKIENDNILTIQSADETGFQARTLFTLR
jgi:hypothetical protein